MKSKIANAVLYCLILLAVALGAYKKGRNDVWIAEYKIYEGNLIELEYFKTNQLPALHEFLKGRYYYLANRLSLNSLGDPYDFGPLNTNIINLGVGKGPTTPQREYALFKEKKITFRIPNAPESLLNNTHEP